MTGIFFEAAGLTALSDNAFGMTGILDKYGSVLGIVFAVFGFIMLSFSFKVKKMGSFYLEMDNKEPIIKETGFLPYQARIADHRIEEIGSMKLSEVLVEFELDGETYSKWTPDLGFEDTVNIEYDPNEPGEFYISDKLDAPEEEQAPDITEDGEEVEELGEPANKAFYAMLFFGIALLGIGAAFLYDFYILK